MARPERPRPARERLLAAAAELFYANGTTATGIDSITEHAGVARKSLYNNFASKDELVLAYLEARHLEWLELYRRRREAVDGAAAGVLAVFDAYLDHASAAYPRGFRGCGLLNAAAELPAGSRGRSIVASHKAEVETILADHLAGLLPGDDDAARDLAEHLSFLLEGAMARAGLEGRPDRLLRARSLAARLIHDAARPRAAV